MIVVNAQKEKLRNSILAQSERSESSFASPGILAEHLRKTEIYKKAQQLFVSPANVLSQIRINTLIDGKELVMPGPGLREGFYLLEPYTIPYNELVYATIYKGLLKYGKHLNQKESAGLSVDLLITDTMTVDSQGYFLGDGKGFFDLAYASLFALGGLAPAVKVVAVPADNLRTGSLPYDPWDIRIDAFLDDKGVTYFEERQNKIKKPQIYWNALSTNRIKRLAPLWWLYKPR